MKNSMKIIWCFFIPLFLHSISFGEAVSRSPTAAPRFPGIKAEFDNAWANAITRDQKLKIMRDTVGKGRHAGEPVLNRMFKNFDPAFFKLDPDLPGVKENVKFIASDNCNKSKGHARELIYANSFERDGRFKMNSIGEQRKYPNLVGPESSSGKLITKGESDLSLIHKETGQKIRVEVKKIKLSTQISNLEKYKRQIIKMGYDLLYKGETQVFANRHEVTRELKDFAKKHGIQVVENLSSKTDPKPPSKSINSVLNELDRDCRSKARISALTGSTMHASLGIYFAIQSAIKLKTDIDNFDRSEVATFRVAKDGAFFLSGLSFVGGQGANLALQNPKWENSKYLKNVSRYAARVGIAFAVLGEGLEIYEYARGHQTPREFYRGQASIVAGIGGGLGGAYAGALVCAPIFPPFGSIAGGIVFGVGGGLFGSSIAEKATNTLYYFNDKILDDRFAEILEKHYAMN